MKREDTDYPQGDGQLGCPSCKGRGVVPVPKEELPAHCLPGTTRYCECVYKRDLMTNLKRGWKPLAKVPSTKGSPLIGKVRENLWIRCDDEDQSKGHLRAAVLRQSPRWRFKVVSDADIMQSWLYSANEVHDADVGLARVRGENTASRITDLVGPYELVIFMLGVKIAPNKESATVFLEALKHREYLGLPSWVVDPPTTVSGGHRVLDYAVESFLDNFEWVYLGELQAIADEVEVYRPSISSPPIEIQRFEHLLEEGDAEVEDDDGSVLDSEGRPIVRKQDWRNR